MFAVERLGSYISRGVCTVSRPLQPFGGAVDIIVVEQPDGTFKSCPWYVRFGKSQSGLSPEEKVVRINVNDVDADFHMYLDNNGDAYLLKEVDEAESFASFGDENVLSPRLRRMQKSRSCDYDVNRTHFVSEFEAANGNTLTRANSRRGGLFGLSFGRKSNMEGDFPEVKGTAGATNSLARAEMAADLLEVRWTTNLGTDEKWKANPPQVPKPKSPVAGDVGKAGIEGAINKKKSLINGHHDNLVDSFSSCVQSTSKKETDAEVPCSVNQGNDTEVCTLEETRVIVDLASNGSEVPYGVADGTIDKDSNPERDMSEILVSVLKVSCSLESVHSESRSSSCEEHSCTGDVHGCGNLMENESRTNNAGSSISTFHVTEENVMPQLGECNGQGSGSVLIAVESMKDSNDQLSVIGSEQVCTVLTSKVDAKNDQNLYPGGLPRQDEDIKEHNVEHAACCNGGEKTLGNITQLDNSEEEQFPFSDPSDCKTDQVDEEGVSSADDGEECLPLDSSQRSEEDMTETINTGGVPLPTTDNLIQDKQVLICASPKFNSKGFSRPISILGYRKGTEELVTPMTQSLPCMRKLGGPEHLSHSLDSNLEAMRIVNDNAQVCSQSSVHSTPEGSGISEEIKSIVADPAVEVSLCRHLLYEGMGYEAAAVAFDAEKLDKDTFTSLALDIIKNDKLVVRIGGLYFPWEAALPIASAIGTQGKEQILEAKGMISVGQANESSEENHPQKNMNPRNGSWKLWPFSFKRTNSVTNIASESASGNSMGKDGGAGKDGNAQKDGIAAKDGNSEKDGNAEKNGNTEKDRSTEKDGNAENGGSTDAAGRKGTKRKVRAKTPTSEQLSALKLKEGKNIVTFTFSTEALGNQQVDARIFLWKWDTRIVISDVDGTITKSDVLGHVMPLMGIDWSQSGVTHLFSAIKENGYQLLFLSARSILQASQTRQFLISLKQEGKSLPEGPIVISPDGLFPSLYREVIRRAPHEFKIACLEDIKALFPRDHNPFYAGFGNRDTDELSYLKVGIPRGKIFTVNPKGEVAVNRRVDTKSYTSLHALVHDMFPPTPVIEQEDYNSWNFWRLPPPDVRI